jgi:hypothetical protein
MPFAEESFHVHHCSVGRHVGPLFDIPSSIRPGPYPLWLILVLRINSNELNTNTLLLVLEQFHLYSVSFCFAFIHVPTTRISDRNPFFLAALLSAQSIARIIKIILERSSFEAIPVTGVEKSFRMDCAQVRAI